MRITSLMSVLARLGAPLTAFTLFLILLSEPGWSQELEPRAYSASPVGTTFLVASYGRSSGSVLLDPTIPITDIQATINSSGIGVGQTFGLFHRQCLLTAALPYAWGSITGSVDENTRSITRSGLSDLRMKMSMNFIGSPAMSPEEFAKQYRPKTIVGASLTVSAPTGQYDPAKLINLGSNRWALKPEIGVSFPVKKLYLDAYVGAWFFTDNSAYFPGNADRTQDPVTTVQGHVSYTFRPRLWLAMDATWYRGGGASINNGPSMGEQNNSRAGVTLSLPIFKGQSVKVAFSTGTTASVGSKFNTLSIAWQKVWFDHR
jgi:hypothetical protein